MKARIRLNRGWVPVSVKLGSALVYLCPQGVALLGFEFSVSAVLDVLLLRGISLVLSISFYRAAAKSNNYLELETCFSF